MTVKEYLLQIKKNNIRINQLKRQIDCLRSEVVFIPGIDYSKDRVQSSGDGSAAANKAIERLYDMERRLDGIIDRYMDEKTRIITEIQSLDKPEHIEVLYMRYVEDQSLEQIACSLSYSYYWTAHLHGDALQAFDKKFKVNKKPQDFTK